MEKIKYYEKEYEYIKDESKKEDLKTLINMLPDYYFDVEASSTGKYHPKFTLGKHGLVKHTKVAVRIAHELLENETIGYKFSSEQKDLIIMALVLHDGLKHGLDDSNKYTKFDHPLIISKFIQENSNKLKLNSDDIRTLCNMIETHMGQWTYDKYNKREVLPRPKDEMQRFVHMCDYLASRKFLDVEFDGINIKY